MKKKTEKRHRSTNLPRIWVPLATCPACGSDRLKSYASIGQGDESRLKYSQCKTCGQRFKIILEKPLPNFQSLDSGGKSVVEREI